MLLGGVGAYLAETKGIDLRDLYQNGGASVGTFSFDLKIHAKLSARTLLSITGMVYAVTLLTAFPALSRLKKLNLADRLR
jgi:hypothetical protein